MLGARCMQCYSHNGCIPTQHRHACAPRRGLGTRGHARSGGPQDSPRSRLLRTAVPEGCQVACREAGLRGRKALGIASHAGASPKGPLFLPPSPLGARAGSSPEQGCSAHALVARCAQAEDGRASDLFRHSRDCMDRAQRCVHLGGGHAFVVPPQGPQKQEVCNRYGAGGGSGGWQQGAAMLADAAPCMYTGSWCFACVWPPKSGSCWPYRGTQACWCAFLACALIAAP